MLMHKTRGRYQTQPWDLFHPLPKTPTWEELPRPLQHQLTELLARLLRERSDQKRHLADDKEVGHE
jgi:hypothetical protein